MKKVFIIHGFEGSPNGGWRPWLMGELEKKDIYACALSMQSPSNPVVSEWVEEIARHIDNNKQDEIYLVGHSLGVPTILRYLETSSADVSIAGAVLVSGIITKNDNTKIQNFLDKPFDFKTIKSRLKKVAIIHGDNDDRVPVTDAQILSKELGGELVMVKNGGHLNGSAGWFTLPQCLEALVKMF